MGRRPELSAEGSIAFASLSTGTVVQIQRCHLWGTSRDPGMWRQWKEEAGKAQTRRIWHTMLGRLRLNRGPQRQE